MSWLSRLISDGADPSTLRVAVLFVVVLIPSVWAYCVIHGGQWIPVDGVGSVLGGAGIAKVIQAWIESKPVPRAGSDQ